jgi:hypothetical protein
MSEPVQIILSLLLLVGVFVLTRYIIVWKMRNASSFILRDLEKQQALDPVTAVHLPYTKQDIFGLGMRNYHAKAIEYMLSEGAVGKTSDGKYYLRATSSRAR